MYRYPYSRSLFSRVAKWRAHATGHPLTFVLAAATIALWLITGPLFGFSDTWQLVINTGTTIVTFLMVFLIQNTQNRDSGGCAFEAGRADPHSRGCAQRASRSRGAY
jgi:low affinity Fe/Cu permease